MLLNPVNGIFRYFSLHLIFEVRVMCYIRFLPVLFIFLVVQNFYGQREASRWYFGNGAGLDFNSGSPVALTAGQHNDERSIWVITHFIDTFYAFEVDENGVNATPVTSQTNTIVPTGGYKQNGIGYLKVSPDGKKIGVAHSQVLSLIHI